ncbi:hypothetical protein BGX34_009352 [Mortierella sp. NVP85]|nr:hypothetical protein BGX34_009352 [Mortierella sp. NVP85]
MKVTSIFFTLSAAISVAQAAAVPVLAQDPIKDVSGHLGPVDDSLLTSHGSSVDKIPIFKRSAEEDACDVFRPVNDGGKDGENGKKRPLPKVLQADIYRIIYRIQERLSKRWFGDVDLKLKDHFRDVKNIDDIIKAYKGVNDILVKLPESTQKAIRKTIAEVLKDHAGEFMLKYVPVAMNFGKEASKLCKAIGRFFNP